IKSDESDDVDEFSGADEFSGKISDYSRRDLRTLKSFRRDLTTSFPARSNDDEFSEKLTDSTSSDERDDLFPYA
ncbi:hypothetical protein HID58_001976, partial [Brassica napus]